MRYWTPPFNVTCRPMLSSILCQNRSRLFYALFKTLVSYRFFVISSRVLIPPDPRFFQFRPGEKTLVENLALQTASKDREGKFPFQLCFQFLNLEKPRKSHAQVCHPEVPLLPSQWRPSPNTTLRLTPTTNCRLESTRFSRFSTRKMT